MKRIASLFIILFSCTLVIGQDSLSRDIVHPRRLRNFTIAASSGYAITMAGLFHLWYKDTERQPFTFFNDNAEWKQLDKAGHVYSTFHISQTTYRALTWSGMPENKALVAGAITGFATMLPIELMDGFSDAYGASTGDLIANAGGSLLFLSQQLTWNEIRIHPKFSFHLTQFAQQRPELLGDSFITRMLKDYNGQTYWLSFDTDKFLPFPKWLNFAVGYGADNMVFGRDPQNEAIGLNPSRKIYLAIDLDPTAIRTRSKLVQSLIYIVNLIHIPAPAIEFSNSSVRFLPFHY